jgi:predicted lipoprotein with Yx(FWY)xxD motif
MKKSPLYWIGGFVVIFIAVYAGYRLVHHFAYTPTVPVATQTTTTPTSSTAAPSDNIYLVKTNPAKGKYLTDFQGNTLYIFDKDTDGISNCTGNCLVIWPIYTSGATAQGQFPANITVIKRSDGTEQFAWKGKPLYYYASDKAAGDINGDGVGGVWHIVTP